MAIRTEKEEIIREAVNEILSGFSTSELSIEESETVIQKCLEIINSIRYQASSNVLFPKLKQPDQETTPSNEETKNNKKENKK